MPAQNSLTSFDSVNRPTMSSLEMVEFINSQRQAGEPDSSYVVGRKSST